MKKRATRDHWMMPGGGWEGPPVALFWDQSLVWGLMCLETLGRLGVPFRLLTSRDIRAGELELHRVVLVPGGWASHKVQELGEKGRAQLEQFIRNGGSYLGFCGGAGMALSSPPSLGLVPLNRMPLRERLPSASGEVWIEGNGAHPVWKDLPGLLPVTVWWPSQFHNPAGHEVAPIATYRSAGQDFMVADLHVDDLATAHGGRDSVPWEALEEIYGINLNPARLLGDAAMVEASLGKGRLILSYPHLETPGETWGNRLCANILKYLDQRSAEHFPSREAPGHPSGETNPAFIPQESLEALLKARDMAMGLIGLGERNLLWRWRNPWLLSWRRGVRGLEYGMLAVSLNCAVSMARRFPRGEALRGSCPLNASTARELHGEVSQFCSKAQHLLMEEKAASQDGGISKLNPVNRSVDELRRELFGTKMNHSGLSRSIFDLLDRILLDLVRAGEESRAQDHTLNRK